MTDVSAAGAVRALDVQGALDDGLNMVVTFVPKFLAFAVILILGWIVAKFVAKAVDKVLERVGFDRAVERGGIRKALERSKYDASDLVSKLVYYALLLFTLQLAFGVWGPNPVSDMLRSIVAWLPQALVAVVIVVVAAAIANAVRDLVSGALAGMSYGKLLGNIAAIFILGLGIIAALNQIGVATAVTTPVLITVLATFAGILIVGVGGGLVRPMQDRWGRWLDRAEQEAPLMRQQTAAYQRGRTDVLASAGHAQPTQVTTEQPTAVTERSGTAYAGQTRAEQPPAGSRPAPPPR